jgi:MYXO-CTERM domain-containing protein
VDAGRYDNDTCAWSTDALTVRSVGGRAKIALTSVGPAQKKGIFTIAAPNATVEGFELSGAAIAAGDGNNGAGIRHQGTNLTVRDCFFHDNQDGILGAPAVDGEGAVVIESSEFAGNGAGDGLSHNMYLNHYASFTLRASYSHGAKVGHLVKTRANVNLIAYNRITDEAGTTASYEIDAPNGGTTYILGNLIEQSEATQNPSIVAAGEEGTSNPDQHFFFINNTVVNRRLAGGTFLNLAAGTTALVQNNIFVGPGAVTSLAGATLKNNWTDAQGDPLLADAAGFDYHLQPGSPCKDQGTSAGAGPTGQSLEVDRQYVHPAGTEGRVVAGASVDLGAYELGGAVALDGGAGGSDAGGGGDAGGPSGLADAGPTPARGDAPAAPSSGCGCELEGTATTTPWVGALAALALALVARRRQRAR